MNWEAIASIGEAVGAIAILITLVYLAHQLKYARMAASDVSRGNRVSAILQLDQQRIENSILNDAWIKASGPDTSDHLDYLVRELDLTTEEAGIVAIYAGDWIWTHWAQFRSIKSQSDMDELENIVFVFYSVNPMKTFIGYQPIRAYLDSDCMDWIDGVLEKNKT